MRLEGGHTPSPRLATPTHPPPARAHASHAPPRPRLWHKGCPAALGTKCSFFDPRRRACRASVEAHRAALAAASAVPTAATATAATATAATAAAAAAAATLATIVVRAARPIVLVEGHRTRRDVHAIGRVARGAWGEGRVHVHLKIRLGHRVATAAASTTIAAAAIAAAAIAAAIAAAAIAAIAATAAAGAAVGAKAEATVVREL